MSTQNRRMAQQPSTDPLIELFELDTTPLAAINGVVGLGSVYTWTPGTVGGEAISFGGVTYTPLPIEASGFEWSGQGKLPQPILQITNIGGIAAALVIEFGDLVGAQVTRFRVFESNLDGQPNADSTAYFTPDIFTINRKSEHHRDYISFELRAAFDAQGLRLPRRQVIKNVCTHSYRVWNGSAFLPGSCPYAGSGYYLLAGATTANPTGGTGDPSLDSCGKKISDCTLRFGQAPLPTRAFPGVSNGTGTG